MLLLDATIPSPPGDDPASAPARGRRRDPARARPGAHRPGGLYWKAGWDPGTEV